MEEIPAFLLLIQDALREEVARRFDLHVSPEEIDALSKHADETSRAPHILVGIKDVFGHDTESYRRIYLRPKVIEQKLNAFYSRNPDIHADPIAKIKAAWSDLVRTASMETAAKNHDLTYRELTLGDDQEKKQPDIPYPVEFRNDPVLEIAESMNEGEVFKNVVESDRDFMIIRLKQREGTKHILETIVAEKMPFDEWYRHEVGKLSIVIDDPDLFTKIRAAYPDVWWLQNAAPAGNI